MPSSVLFRQQYEIANYKILDIYRLSNTDSNMRNIGNHKAITIA